jgi:DNA-binding LacI/PurR family transcriptional regulator
MLPAVRRRFIKRFTRRQIKTFYDNVQLFFDENSKRMASTTSRKRAPARALPEPDKKRPTILDVAAACGVSPATVSNVLADKPYIKAETREAVRQKVAELGYRASTAARGLRMGRTWSIGLVIGDISNPFIPEVIRGVQGVIWREKNNLILCNTDFDVDKKMASMHSLLDMHVDGLIVVSQSFNETESRLLSQREMPPLVTINRRNDALDADYVGVDNHAGINAGIDYLASLGHRRIAFVAGLEGSSSASDRLDAFIHGCARCGMTADPALIAQGDYTMESGSLAAAQLLDLASPPSAIMTANDLMAFGVLATLKQRNVAVPKEISVLGFDDVYMSAHPLVNLTTIQHPKYETGATAARLLLRRITESAVEMTPRSVILNPSLIVRGTSGPLAAGASKTTKASIKRRKTTQ